MKGRGDVDALADFLGDRPFLLAAQPSMADTAVFGLLAPMVYWPMHTPVASHVKSIKTIVDYCNRMRQRCFESKRVVAAME
jgi:glutathione S-transferase